MIEEDDYDFDSNYRRMTEDEAISLGYSGICPDCGEPTVNCIVADDACTECGYRRNYYTGTCYN